MFSWDSLHPIILDLIKQAEEKFDKGTEKHNWVVDQVVALPFWPRFVPKSIRRPLASWLVQAVFDVAVKAAEALGRSLFDDSDDEPAPGDAIKPKHIAATDPAALVLHKVPAIKKALATGHFDDRLDEVEAAEVQGLNRKGVLRAIAERRA